MERLNFNLKESIDDLKMSSADVESDLEDN